MKNMKSLLSLLLVMLLCLSMAACGGKSEETTEPIAHSGEQTDIWAMEQLAGVEHNGKAIKAGTATKDQVLFAAVMQGADLTMPEGYTYLKPYVIYFDLADKDCTWHQPSLVYLPGNSAGDNIYYNSYNAVKAEYGNIVLSTQVNTWGLSGEMMDALHATPGWDKLTDVQVQLLYALELRLEEDGLTMDTEGVTCLYNEDAVLGSWDVQTEAGTKHIMVQFYLVATGADGNNAISLIEIHGPDAESAEEDSDYYMTDEDTALLGEILYIYELDKWFA